MEMTACFGGISSSINAPCATNTAIGVVRCSSFLLWRLSHTPECNAGYCTVASGL